MLLYHATNMDNLSSIEEQGIKTNLGGVFFAEHADLAATFLFLRGVDNIVVLAVEFDEEHVEESFDHSEEWFKRTLKKDSCKCYTYLHNVSPEDIIWDKCRIYNL